MADPGMLLSAVLMLVGAFVATGAWLLRRRGARYALVAIGALVFAAGVTSLTLTLS